MKQRYLESDILLVQKFSNELAGVFTISDIQILFNCNNMATLHNRLKRLAKIGILNRFTRGVYITQDYSKDVLSSKIDSTAYLSLGTILSKNGLIGTMPVKQITAVKIGRNRKYQNLNLRINHFGIASHLYFGFTIHNGVKYADNEKAFLDTLYYHMRGHKYSFNPLSDINIGMLERKKLLAYLSHYKNKKFIKFVKQVING